jgi:hypothetical protein
MPARTVAASAPMTCMYGEATASTPAITNPPTSIDSSIDWLNTLLALCGCCAPTACETMATVPTLRTMVSASTTNQMLPAAPTPAMAASPSRETKYRSTT